MPPQKAFLENRIVSAILTLTACLFCVYANQTVDVAQAVIRPYPDVRARFKGGRPGRVWRCTMITPGYFLTKKYGYGKDMIKSRTWTC